MTPIDTLRLNLGAFYLASHINFEIKSMRLSDMNVVDYLQSHP